MSVFEKNGVIIIIKQKPEESDFSFYTTEELSELLAKSPIGNQAKIIEGSDGASSFNVNELVQGKQYWWQCILIVLILLGLEIVIARLWK